MIEVHCDHVAGLVVCCASYKFPDKVHLLSHNHFLYTGDEVKHFWYFIVAQALFLYFYHQNLENALNAAEEKHLQLVDCNFCNNWNDSEEYCCTSQGDGCTTLPLACP
jgi:hypothetical protein